MGMLKYHSAISIRFAYRPEVHFSGNGALAAASVPVFLRGAG